MLDLNKNIILDGAMGTYLMNYGFSIGECIESYNFNNSELIKMIHLKYLKAGADIIITNTFRSNKINLNKFGYDVERTIITAVNIAQKAREEYYNNKIELKEKFIALDIGPIGMMQPYGNMTFKEAYEIFKGQVCVGVKSKVDLIIIETMLSFEEARAAILAAKENSNVPIFCTFTFNKEGKTLAGENIEFLINNLKEFNLDAVGANCSMGIKDIGMIAKEFLKYSSIPIIMKPNLGNPKLKNKKNVYDITPKEFANYMKSIVDSGVSIVGGCCGTTPEYIKELKIM